MAALQTIRERAGVGVGIVIGLALIAFVMGDVFTSGSSIKNSVFKQCDCSSSRFVNTKFKDIELNEVNFNTIDLNSYDMNKVNNMLDEYNLTTDPNMNLNNVDLSSFDFNMINNY